MAYLENVRSLRYIEAVPQLYDALWSGKPAQIYTNVPQSVYSWAYEAGILCHFNLYTNQGILNNHDNW